MSILKDAIAAAIASEVIPELVPTPVAPFGYGRDLSCAWDITADLKETDPESVDGIIESVIRFITTDRDTIPDAPGRGTNVMRFLNRATDPQELRESEGVIRNEIEQDDRIDRAEVSLTLTNNGQRLRVHFKIRPESISLQPFDFVFAVDASGAMFLERLST